MTKAFLYGSLTLGLACLAAGWFSLGYPSVSLSILILIPISLFLVVRKFRPTLWMILALTVFTAGVGLWVGMQLSLALLALVCILSAWDLEAFSRRLAFASPEDNPALIERRHLMQLDLVLLLAVAVDFLSQSIHRVFGFEWALALAILAFYGIGVLVNSMRPER